MCRHVCSMGMLVWSGGMRGAPVAERVHGGLRNGAHGTDVWQWWREAGWTGWVRDGGGAARHVGAQVAGRPWTSTHRRAGVLVHATGAYFCVVDVLV